MRKRAIEFRKRAVLRRYHKQVQLNGTWSRGYALWIKQLTLHRGIEENVYMHPQIHCSIFTPVKPGRNTLRQIYTKRKQCVDQQRGIGFIMYHTCIFLYYRLSSIIYSCISCSCPFKVPSCKNKSATLTLLVSTRIKVCWGALKILKLPIFQHFNPREKDKPKIANGR